MAMSALSTSALSSLEAMLQSLMRGSGGGGGGAGDGDTPVDDTLASPPPPPLPARPTPRGRRPSRRRVRPAAAARTLMPPSSSPRSPSPSPSPSPPKEQEDHARTDDVSLLVEELERKAGEVEAQLRRSEEENAALKRRMESYHIRWLQYEIRIKSLEETFHEQMAALQLAQDAARRAEETAYDRRESSEHHVDAPEEPPVRLWPGRDRMSVGARRSAVSRLGAEFRRQSNTLERGAAAFVAEAPAPSGGGPSSAAADLKKLKAQFRAWTKDYKARLRRTKAELGSRDARRQGSCWI